MSDSEAIALKVADDYRRQRQDAKARKTGFETLVFEEYSAWLDRNQSRLIQVAIANGASAELERFPVDLNR